MAAARIPQMNWATDNHEEALQLFKSNISVYCEDEEITDDRKKALKILRGIGDEGTRRLQVSGLSEEDKRKPDKLWEFFESQLKPKINFSPPLASDGVSATRGWNSGRFHLAGAHSGDEVWIRPNRDGREVDRTDNSIHSTWGLPTWSAGEGERI